MKEFNTNEFATLVAIKEGLISSASDNSATYFISRIRTADVPFCLRHDVTTVILAKLYELGHVQFVKRTLNEVTTYNFELMPTIEFACRDALREPMLRLYVEKIISKEQRERGVDFTETEYSAAFNYLLKSGAVRQVFEAKLGKLKGNTLKNYTNNVLLGEDLPKSGLPGIPWDLDLSSVVGKSEAKADVNPMTSLDASTVMDNPAPKPLRRPVTAPRKNVTAIALADAILADLRMFIVLQSVILVLLAALTPLLTLPWFTALAVVTLFLAIGNLLCARLLPWRTSRLVKGGDYHG